MKGLIDMVNKLISLEELNLLVVLYILINQSCNDKITEVDMKKTNRTDSKIIVKASIVNE